MYLTVSDTPERRYCVRITGISSCAFARQGRVCQGLSGPSEGGLLLCPQPAVTEQPAWEIKSHQPSEAPCSCQIWPLGHPAWPVSLCPLGGVQIEEGSYTPGSVGLWACTLSTAAILVPSSLPCTSDTSKSPFGMEAMKLGASSLDGSC